MSKYLTKNSAIKVWETFENWDSRYLSVYDSDDGDQIIINTTEEAEALIVELQKFIAYKNKQDD